MEKLNPHIGIRVSGFELYKEDIEKVYDLLKDIDSESVRIETRQYRLDNLSELFALDTLKFGKLHIATKDPYVSFDFEDGALVLYSDKDTLEMEGLLARIRTIVEVRKRFRRGRYFRFVFFLVVMLVGIGLLIVRALIFGKQPLWVSIVLGALVGVVGSIVGDRFGSWGDTNAVIFNRSRKELPSFWQRQKDNILVNLVYFILGAFVSYLISSIVKH
jgi:hypothetical protein